MHYDCCFGGQIRTRAVSAKQMTMVSPIQLLLFASRTVTAQGPNLVQLDNWSVTLSVCLPAWPSACLSVCGSICLSICSLHPALSQHRVPAWCSWITGHSCCLSVCLSVCPSVCLSVCLSICFLHPALSQHRVPAWCSWITGHSCCLSVCLYVHPSVCLSACLSAFCTLHCHSTESQPGAAGDRQTGGWPGRQADRQRD